MAKPLNEMTNAALANEIDKRELAARKTSDAIFAAALHSEEKGKDIMARLGAAHPLLVEYNAKCALLWDAELIGRCRVGRADYLSTVVMYLRQSPRYKPKPTY